MASHTWRLSAFWPSELGLKNQAVHQTCFHKTRPPHSRVQTWGAPSGRPAQSMAVTPGPWQVGPCTARRAVGFWRKRQRESLLWVLRNLGGTVLQKRMSTQVLFSGTEVLQNLQTQPVVPVPIELEWNPPNSWKPSGLIRNLAFFFYLFEGQLQFLSVTCLKYVGAEKHHSTSSIKLHVLGGESGHQNTQVDRLEGRFHLNSVVHFQQSNTNQSQDSLFTFASRCL